MISQRFSSRRASNDVSRRTFVKGLAVGGAVAGLGLWRTSALAQDIPSTTWTTLSGTDFDSAHRRDADEFHRASANRRHRERLHASADTALEGGRHGHAASREHVATRMPRFTGTALCCRPTWTAFPVSASTGFARAKPTCTGSRCARQERTGTTVHRLARQRPPGADLRRPEEHVCGSGWSRTRPDHRTASDRPHREPGALGS